MLIKKRPPDLMKQLFVKMVDEIGKYADELSIHYAYPLNPPFNYYIEFKMTGALYRVTAASNTHVNLQRLTLEYTTKSYSLDNFMIILRTIRELEEGHIDK